jgi:site-specific recombinase XerD
VRRRADPLLALVESYFTQHLRRVRGASVHTVRAYGHALRLFFSFVAKRTRRSISALCLDDITIENVLAFLDDLESGRGNTPATRNCRLAAVRGLVEHLLRHDLSRAKQYQRILSVRAKKARGRAVTYLEPEQVRAILARPDRRTSAGRHDHALLLFLYNTGARVSEALALTPADVEGATLRPRHVRVHGKGNKERCCPLWPETAAALAHVIADDGASAAHVFRNARGEPLTRDGVAYVLSKYVQLAATEMPTLRRQRVTPHVLRHSCAVALLQAGVDITVIRDYLGHASVATTGRYLTTNMKLKRDVLSAFWRRAGLTRSPARRWRPTSDLIAFLSSL